ncbi:MAG: DUF5640 domain-containing protein [Eubacteriales bacterium]|nr:DUF5640 domain-containing protein [Eubacteriales bacterium]
MKKLFTAVLALCLVLALAACGKGDTAANNETKAAETTAAAETKSGTGSGAAEATAAAAAVATAGDEGSYIVMWYAGNNEDGDAEATFYCPEGATIDESDIKEFLADGFVFDFRVTDNAREYMAIAENIRSREYSPNELKKYDITPQLYFYGELDEINASQVSNATQEVIDLGFQWEGHEMKLIKTHWTADGKEKYDYFVGVEYELMYAGTKDGKLGYYHAPGLLGFHVLSLNPMYDELPNDHYAWIAGQLFGVKSGRMWIVDDEPQKETTAAVVEVKAGELIGVWEERDSDWHNTYTFNEDGTGILKSGPEYPFTYMVEGDTLYLAFDYEEKYQITAEKDLLILLDKFGNNIYLDRKQDKETETEAETEETEAMTESEKKHPLMDKLIGKWVDNETEYRETFIFNEDGTGMYSYLDGGETYSWEFVYKLSETQSSRVDIEYDDGDKTTNYVDIDGDLMLLSNDAVYEMPFDRE